MNASSAHAHSFPPAAATRAGSPHSEPARATAPRGFVQPEERTRTGRPTLQTPEIVECICAQIRTHGISDSSAGLLAGISTSTISRWKQEDEDFATLLGQARAQYDVARLSAIRAAQKRDGSVDWRAQAWLLQNSSPEEYGRPSRRSKYRRRTAAESMVEIQASDVTIITEAELALIEAARAQAAAPEHAAAAESFTQRASATTVRAAAKMRPKIPETPEFIAAAPAGADASASAQPVPNVPETRRPLSGQVRPAGLRLHVPAEGEHETNAATSSRNSSLHAAA